MSDQALAVLVTAAFLTLLALWVPLLELLTHFFAAYFVSMPPAREEAAVLSKVSLDSLPASAEASRTEASGLY